MIRIHVPISRRQFGEVVLEIPEEEADQLIGDTLSPQARKRRVQKLAIKKCESGEGVSWFDDPGGSDMSVSFGYFVE